MKNANGVEMQVEIERISVKKKTQSAAKNDHEKKKRVIISSEFRNYYI